MNEMRLLAPLVFLLLSIISQHAHSQERFNISKCPLENPKCKDPDPLKLSFEVDVKNQKILVTMHDMPDKGKKDIIIWDAKLCSIFDKKNWDCHSPSFSWRYRMVGGELRYITNPSGQYIYTSEKLFL